MKELTHLSLCSGIGGIDLAAERAGFITVAQCEIDEYASKVLAKNFKGVPNLHDIRTVTDERIKQLGIGTPTVISAGFPCQPYSLAGKGLGDRDVRDLWGEVARVLGEVRPKWFVGENTPGLFARNNQRYFRRILDDLTALGYTVGWGIWGACDVGAPHRRDRVFIVAYTDGRRRKKNDAFKCRTGEALGKKGRENKFSRTDCFPANIPDAASDIMGLFGSEEETQKTRRNRDHNGNGTQRDAGGEWWKVEPDVGGSLDGVSDRLDKIRGLNDETKSGARKILSDLRQKIGEKTIQREIGKYGEIQFAEILLSVLCKYASKCNKSGTALESGTVAKGEVRDLWEQIKSSCASCGREYKQQYAGEYTNSLRKLSCKTPSYYAQTWREGSWESGIDRVSTECPHRVDRLRCLGNAVVPQQVYPIFRAIAELEEKNYANRTNA